MVVHDGEDCPNNKRLDDLVDDIRAIQIQLAEINVGVQKDVKYIRETLESMKSAQDSTQTALSALTICSAGISTLNTSAKDTKDSLEKVSRKVDKHDTYFAIMSAAFLLVFTWVTGFFSKLFGS
jgi:prefoldin subunit 5